MPLYVISNFNRTKFRDENGSWVDLPFAKGFDSYDDCLKAIQLPTEKAELAIYCLNAFTKSYIETALWSSTDDMGMRLTQSFGTAHIANECLMKMILDCHNFVAENGHFITSSNLTKNCDPDIKAGHDFWLTRNRHGAGFWDGDWVDPVGKELSEASRKCGSCDLYIGKDNSSRNWFGLIYCN